MRTTLSAQQDILTVWHAIWNTTLTLIRSIVLSLLSDEAGFSRRATLHLARRGRGSGTTLLTLLIVFSTLVTDLCGLRHVRRTDQRTALQECLWLS
ncbi:ArsB/NhaD family transporter [Deinococcus rubellus]|uniref:ArsB/NhaD family transporter n=1 Tax=Deinococcus rubellus TaxID=1889240 RepID=UPI0031E600AA